MLVPLFLVSYSSIFRFRHHLPPVLVLVALHPIFRKQPPYMQFDFQLCRIYSRSCCLFLDADVMRGTRFQSIFSAYAVIFRCTCAIRFQKQPHFQHLKPGFDSVYQLYRDLIFRMNEHLGFRFNRCFKQISKHFCGIGWNKDLFIILYVMKQMDVILIGILTLVVALLVAAYQIIGALQ